MYKMGNAEERVKMNGCRIADIDADSVRYSIT